MKDIVLLKNVSDKPFSFEVTKNPMLSGPESQFSIREDDVETNELQTKTQKEILEKAMKKAPHLRERLSTLTKITFEPGEMIKFGRGQKYNVMQAEYIYRNFGGYAEFPNGAEMVQPIIELTEEGEEDKTGFYPKYRMKKSIDVSQMPHIATKEQFNVPVKS